MLFYLLIWGAVGLALAAIAAGNRSDSAGLPFAYFLSLSLIHAPGALLVGENGTAFPELTLIGFRETAFGLVAFLIGVTASYRGQRKSRQRPAHAEIRRVEPAQLAALDRTAFYFLLTGGFAFFIALPLLGGMATVTAVISSLGSLIVVGICLRLWIARRTGNTRKFWTTVALLPLLPIFTVVQSGFLGYGTNWLVVVGGFMFGQARRRAGIIIAAPILAFLGLSFFVNYAASRDEIRQSVWGGAALEDRITKVTSIFDNFEWLDLSNPDQAVFIDARLNQNWLVGMAIERLDSGQTNFLNGSSFGAMLLALIPRAVWPDKPAVGGGGTIVRDVTGQAFADGTSVGAGQVLEFYANFGLLGVLIGFAFWGWLLGYLDRKTVIALYQGDMAGFILPFLVAIPLIAPGGNLLEIQVTAVTSAVAAIGINGLMNWRARNTIDQLAKGVLPQGPSFGGPQPLPPTALRPGAKLPVNHT